jgi:predicted O-linked N-acetylglucosamine transferase (SPINDLY family)
LCGRSFAARMAGALLTAADLPELICYDLKSYEEKAVALAQQPSECARLRAHLQTVRSTGRLFDTTAFARHLESALEGLVQAL